MRVIIVEEKREEIKREQRKPISKDRDFMDSKWFKLLLIAIAIIILVVKFAFPEKPLDERLGYAIGNYEYTHKTHDGTEVYRLVTPRGPEWVRGRSNLDLSLEVYAEEGRIGEDYRIKFDNPEQHPTNIIVDGE